MKVVAEAELPGVRQQSPWALIEADVESSAYSIVSLPRVLFTSRCAHSSRSMKSPPLWVRISSEGRTRNSRNRLCKYGDSKEKGKLRVRYFSLGSSMLKEASWRKFVESEGKGKVIERDGVLVSHFRGNKFGTDMDRPATGRIESL